jgi:hypothetical protein
MVSVPVSAPAGRKRGEGAWSMKGGSKRKSTCKSDCSTGVVPRHPASGPASRLKRRGGGGDGGNGVSFCTKGELARLVCEVYQIF